MSKIGSITKNVFTALSKWKPYIYHKVISGSVYIKFPHWGLGSIRIGDHNGRGCYSYRWRIRMDKAENYYKKGTHKQISFVECESNAINDLVIEFEQQAKTRKIHPGEKAIWKT